MDEYLAHHGIRGQRWGIRNYQNPDGSLTTAGRLRYGVGSGLRGGVFNTSGAVSKAYGYSTKAKRLARFGTALAKAKSEQYANSGRYKVRKAKSEIARRIRGNAANQQIAKDNRRRQWDYKISRAQAKGFINHLAGSTYNSVFSASDARFKSRISVGQRYVELSKRYVPRAVINKIQWDNIENTLPEIHVGIRSMAGLTRVRLK